MLNRKMLIRTAIGLVAAGALAVPSLVSAASVVPIAVSHDSTTPSVNTAGATTCDFLLSGSWDADATKGPSVNVQLWESVDGGAFSQVGNHLRIGDGGGDAFMPRYRDPGSTHDYEIRITKGPKHVVGFGSITGITCAS